MDQSVTTQLTLFAFAPQPMHPAVARVWAGRARKDLIVAAAIEKETAPWRQNALQVMNRWCQTRRLALDPDQLLVRIEEFREWSDSHYRRLILTPVQWGQVGAMGVRAGMLQWTGGYTTSRAKSAKNTPVKVYRIL